MGMEISSEGLKNSKLSLRKMEAAQRGFQGK